MSCIARGVLRGWRTAWCSVRPNRTLCSYRASGESESTVKVEVNERHISDGMGVVRVVHRAGEVKRGRREAASLSEGGLLEEMWWREVPVKWRAEGRRFQGEEGRGNGSCKGSEMCGLECLEKEKSMWEGMPENVAPGESKQWRRDSFQDTEGWQILWGHQAWSRSLRESCWRYLIAGCLFPVNSKPPPHIHTAQSWSLRWLAHCQSWSFLVIPVIGICVHRGRAQRTRTVRLTASERVSHICFTTNQMSHVPVKPLDWLIMSESRYQKWIIYSNYVIAENN